MAFAPVDIYISDPHGEYEEFSHILRSACGAIRSAMDECFGGALSGAEKDELATLVYYPEEKLRQLEQPAKRGAFANATAGQFCCFGAWKDAVAANLRALLDYMDNTVEAASCAASNGSDAADAAADADAAGATDTAAADAADAAKTAVTDTEIISLATAIRYTAVRAIHMVGDIFDRGPLPDKLMDELCAIAETSATNPAAPTLDIQWGNHDILWMGAALGQAGCVANAVRICARYNNFDVLEENYGIDLSALRNIAQTVYANDPAGAFIPKNSSGLPEDERLLRARMQKAICYIQFKVEAQIINENPSFGLDDRNLLHHIDFEAGTVELDGTVYPLRDTLLPTVDPADPYRMTAEEQAVMDALVNEFVNCEQLQRHVKLFLTHGSLYKRVGNNLLFHAAVPLDADGKLLPATIYGKTAAGRELFDDVDGYVRDAYTCTDTEGRKRGLDLIWWLWLDPFSPLFAKSKMATFELYLIEDKATQKEVKNPYYSLQENEAVMNAILEEFGMDAATGHMISGHVPVKVKDGEDPVKCGGKVMIIDGGMSAAYQGSTGIAGLTLVKPVKGTGFDAPMYLYEHKPFCGRAEAIANNTPLESRLRTIIE